MPSFTLERDKFSLQSPKTPPSTRGQLIGNDLALTMDENYEDVRVELQHIVVTDIC